MSDHCTMNAAAIKSVCWLSMWVINLFDCLSRNPLVPNMVFFNGRFTSKFTKETNKECTVPLTIISPQSKSNHEMFVGLLVSTSCMTEILLLRGFKKTAVLLVTKEGLSFLELFKKRKIFSSTWQRQLTASTLTGPVYRNLSATWSPDINLCPHGWGPEASSRAAGLTTKAAGEPLAEAQRWRPTAVNPLAGRQRRRPTTGEP